jgi:HTH-like domain/Integrase core domain
VTRYIDEQRVAFGVEPICQALAIAPSSYYAARSRPPSAQAVRDATLEADISRIHRTNYAVYGARKLWHALRREDTVVGRDQVGRLMRGLGLAGAVRGKTRRTTVSSELSPRPADLVERVFAAPAPNRLWLADITYVSTWSGFCYTSFVIDAFSRRIVGWRVSSSLRAELALDALEMAIWSRRPDDLAGLVHHIAVSSGLPLMITGEGGLPATVCDYEAASLVPSPDLVATRGAIKRPATFRRRRFFDSRSWSRTIDRYTSLIARTRHGPRISEGE